jgi:tetratricopeptide (TPR) repeat protein
VNETKSSKTGRNVKILLLLAAIVFLFLEFVLARPSPSDRDAMNWPIYHPIVNGQHVTVEVIPVNGLSVPASCLEKAIERLDRYVTGKVHFVEGDAVNLELGGEGGVALKQLDPVLDGSTHSGPCSIALILVPSIEGVGARGLLRGPTQREDGRTRQTVVLCCEVIEKETLGIQWLRNMLVERVISHELLHILGVLADRSHAAEGRHCTNPECLLYFGIDHRSFAASILHFGPPRGLCRTCEGEIRSALLAANGQLFDPGQPYDPMEIENEKVRLNPEHPDAYSDRGRVYMNRKQWEPALSDLTKAIELDPEKAWRHGIRSEVHEAAGDLKSAYDDLTRTIELDPSDVIAYERRASIHFQRGDYGLAVADLSRGIEVDPGNVTLRHNRAAAHFRQGEYEKAIADCSKTIGLAPENVSAHKIRAVAYEQTGQFAKAVKDYESAILMDESLHPFMDRLASILATRPEESLRDGKRAVELAGRACQLTDWKEAAYLDTLAAACAETGDCESACRNIEKAIVLVDDSTTEAQYRERLSLYRSGRPFRQDPP